MDVFYILQILGNKFLNICQVSYKLSFSFLWWNSWGKINLSPGVGRYYYICKVSTKILLNATYGKKGEMVNPPAFCSPWQLFFFILFTGMRFALMQMKTGLCHILSRFEVAPCKETPVRIVYEATSFFLHINGDFRLSFKRIQFWNNIYIYICTIHHKYRHKYSYLITTLGKALLERPVFSRQVGNRSVHYKLSTS